MLALALCGCGDTAPPPPITAMAGEPAWSDQIEAVRSGQAREIRVERQIIGPADWAALADGCSGLSALEAAHAEIEDSHLQIVAVLPGLKRLRLGAPVGDAGAAHLAACEELTVLNLPAAAFSDAGLARLAQLPRLELLRFHSPHVTNAGLAHIADMESLRFLHLIDVPVTDAGLAHLHRMTWLESFYLDGGECTDEGLSALLQALPELHFHKDQLHVPGDPRAHPHE
jgi:hypothetical protein